MIFKMLLCIWTLLLSAFIRIGYVKADESVGLECAKDGITITFSDRFLEENDIEVTDQYQLHMKDFPECSANVEQGGYSITLYAPYKNCGTSVTPGPDAYSYFNEVVFAKGDIQQVISEITCNYDRRYVVSSDLALNPTIRTLNFVTKRGEFSVGMSLYQRRDFNPKSMFNPRPTVLVGTSVYVSVDTFDTIGKNEIVTSIETCYATDERNHAIQNLYHNLIVNKCSSPDDDTVEIISNGEDLSARFKFAMFSWKNRVEYFYLHCEVKVCNTTEEQCSGVGPVCNGVMDEDIPSRRRRDLVEEEDSNVIKGNTGIVSYGPIALRVKGQGEVGQGSYELVYEEIEKDQRFLQTYIYIIIAAVVLVAGIVSIIVTVVRKTRAAKKQKLSGSVGSIDSSQI